MTTALVSDLHLGSSSGRDLARCGEPLARLVDALARAEHIVLLGDVVELREQPVAAALESARPFFEALGEAARGRRVTLVPGNHDHELADPFLTRLQLDGRPLEAEQVWSVRPGDGLAGRLTALMPHVEIGLAYPGLQLREDVYATHGHYLDPHLSVPRLESLAASAMARLTGRRALRGRPPAEYEAVLAPLYALAFGLAQGATRGSLERGSTLSRQVWSHSSAARGGRRLTAFGLGRVAIPAGVAALNRAGLGPFSSDLSGSELRRAGLRAIVAALDGLDVDARHVVFGHTHRPGPLAGDAPGEWRTPGGTRLWNTGSWFHEPVFLSRDGGPSPYRPGTLVRLPDAGDPELVRVLGPAQLPDRAQA